MRFLSTLVLLVTASTAASAAPLSTRATTTTTITADTLIQDITNIHAGVLACEAATQADTASAFVTSLLEGTPILLAVGAIHVANRKGYGDANSSPAIGQPDTVRIFQHTVDTVGVSIPAAVRAISAKKAQFAAAGIGGVVTASLKLLLDDHDSFSAALTAKAYTGNATLTAQGVNVVQEIHDAIQGGIDAFST